MSGYNLIKNIAYFPLKIFFYIEKQCREPDEMQYLFRGFQNSIQRVEGGIIPINDNLLNCLFSGHLIHKAGSTNFSDSVSLSFKTGLTSVTCFVAMLRNS